MRLERFDGVQLPSPLAFNDSEFSWYIFEIAGSGRRFAGLVSIHRTGPRARSVRFGPRLLSGRDLPSPLRDLVPSWLPILSPVAVDTDDRPLLMVALYDVTERTLPWVMEHEVEHCDFDPDTFTATAGRGALAVTRQGDIVAIHARTPAFSLELRVRPTKPPIVFGAGSPTIRHGTIATSYVQRPRLEVTGSIEVAAHRFDGLAGEGVHDHQWLRVTAPNLKWMWPHLRLPDGRELTGYVIRDSSGGRHADADMGRELARGGWIVERDGRVRSLASFDIRASAHVETERGRVPTHFCIETSERGLDLELEHVVPAPFLRMRAFGDVLDGGIYEGPVEVRDHPEIRGWVEVMNAAHVRLK